MLQVLKELLLNHDFIVFSSRIPSQISIIHLIAKRDLQMLPAFSFAVAICIPSKTAQYIQNIPERFDSERQFLFIHHVPRMRTILASRYVAIFHIQWL